MAQIKIDVADFRVVQYELSQSTSDGSWSFNFTVGLYNSKNEFITTVNFSNDGFSGHKFNISPDIHDKIRNLLVSIDELVSENNKIDEPGTGV